MLIGGGRSPGREPPDRDGEVQWRLGESRCAAQPRGPKGGGAHAGAGREATTAVTPWSRRGTVSRRLGRKWF